MAQVSSASINESMEQTEKIEKPHVILLFSGKRKSGKDYVTDKLYERLGPQKSVVIKISGPIKHHWAKLRNLDIDKLMGNEVYKEAYRKEMIQWSEDVRKNDYGYFCRAAVEMYKANGKGIWIVSDIRRKSDIKWFNENYGKACKTIKIICSDETRKSRGWIFVSGIDDAESECNLDDVTEWDLIINNDNKNIEDIMQNIINLIEKNY